MATTIYQPNQIGLNGVVYAIEGAVETELASVYPAKTVIGEYTLTSRPRASVKTWSDWRGGMGLERESTPTLDRCWYSQLHLRFNRHLTLPRLVTQTSSSGEAAYASAIGNLGGVLYVAFGTKVRSYTLSTDVWSGVLDTLPAAATCVLRITLGGTTYLIFGSSTTFTWTSNGSAFTDVTKASRFLAEWDNKLWGISNQTGQLWYTPAVATAPTDDAVLELPANSIRSLFVGPDAYGDDILYVGASDGLYSHDFANGKFWKTRVRFAYAASAGAACEWMGNIYICSGAQSVREYNPMAGTVRLVGPDLDDGLPSGYAATPDLAVISSLIPSQNELLAHEDYFGSVLGWDGRGWQVLVRRSDTFSSIAVAEGYSLHQLWAGFRTADYALLRLSLPLGIANPSELASMEYDRTQPMELETSWFSPGEPDEVLTALDGTAITAGVGSTTPTTAETVTIGYRLNYSTGSFTTLGSAITCEALKTTAVSFPNNTTPTGTEFKAIQFKFTLARGTTGSNPEKKSPDLIAFTLAYRKKLAEKWRFGVTIDGFNPISTNTPESVMAAVRAAIGSTTKVEFVFRDPVKDTTQVFYVDVVAVKILEQTGLDERSKIKLLLEEV